MPKRIDWEEIRKYWQKTGASPEALIDRFGVSRRSIDERLAQWRAEEKPPKVVTFERKSKEFTHPPIRRTLPPAEGIDELEAIEIAIADLMASLPDAGDRSKGGIAGALIRLFERRDKLQPKTAAEVVELAIELGISPTEFAREMREQWQQRQA